MAQRRNAMMDSKSIVRSACLVTGASLVVFVGCRTPTQVTVELATDVPCGEVPDTTVQVGRIGPDVEARPASIATRACRADGRIGSFVVVPSGEADDEFAMKVILGHSGKTAASCRADEQGASALPDCIIARRGLHFLPHTELKMFVMLRADCDGIVCSDPQTTCVGGSCVPAVIRDPRVCLGDGCHDAVLGVPDGGVVPDGGPSDAADAADAESDADKGSDAANGGDAGNRGDADAAGPTDVCTDGGCTPPSCAVPLTCGLAGDSCCESPLVTGDSFLRQNDQGYPATVSSFRLDKYETTVGRFRAFVTAMSASQWLPPAGSGKHTHLPRGGLYSINDLGVETGWNPAWNTLLPQAKTVWDGALDCIGATWTPDPGPNEHRPIVCTDWYDAYAFCIWDGGFLPSYAEWNFAAAGGRDQRAYPWGNTAPDLQHAQYCVNNCTTLINVGSLIPGNGRYGQSDLAGNSWEWALDVSPGISGDMCEDCVFLDQQGATRAGVSGGFDSPVTTIASDYVYFDVPDNRDRSSGFRCARPP